MKTIAETNNIFDVSVYPANLPVFAVLATWLQKAVAAREAAIAYHLEANRVSLEGDEVPIAPPVEE